MPADRTHLAAEIRRQPAAWPRLRPARMLSGNPTGTGDALSATAVATPHAGVVDLREYDRRAGILVETWDARR